MKVVVFEPTYSEKQKKILRAVAAGIKKHVEHTDICPLHHYVECDIAVIFGLSKKSYPATWPKKEILAKHSGRRLIVVESAFVNRGAYWNVGFGGINGGADFRTEGMPRDRWDALAIPTPHWRKRDDGPIILSGQVPWDTNVQDMDHVGWCRQTLDTLREMYPKARVLFRPHPRMVRDNWKSKYPALASEVPDTAGLSRVLKMARCLVTWNSNSGVDAAIAGVPVVALNEGSGAWPVANHSLEDIADLQTPDRNDWLAGIGYSQWNLEEMKEGLPWQHLMRDLDEHTLGGGQPES